MRQLNTQQQVRIMTMQAQLVVVFIQLGLRLMAMQAVDQGLEPTAMRCL